MTNINFFSIIKLFIKCYHLMPIEIKTKKFLRIMQGLRSLCFPLLITLALLCDNKGPSAVCQQKSKIALTLNYLYGPLLLPLLMTASKSSDNLIFLDIKICYQHRCQILYHGNVKSCLCATKNVISQHCHCYSMNFLNMKGFCVGRCQTITILSLCLFIGVPPLHH